MRTALLLSLLVGYTTSALGQGCDTVFVGTVDGVSSGANDTPFPTQAADLSRVQYLFQASELNASGCSIANGIEGICLQVLDDDSVGLGGTWIEMYVTLKHTFTSSITSMDLTVPTPPYNAFYIPWPFLQQGLLSIPFDSAFYWDGTSNVLVEINYTRGALAGINPRVVLDTGLGFSATHWAQAIGPIPGAGYLLTDSTPLTVSTGSETSRPVMGFILSGSTAVHDQSTDQRQLIWTDPITGNTIIPASTLRSDDRELVLIDAGGRIVAIQQLNSTNSDLTIHAGDLNAGIYVAQLVNEATGRRCIGRFVAR